MKYTMKQMYMYRTLNWMAFAFFALIVPILLISYKYDLYTKVGEYKPEAAGMIVVIIILFFLREEIKKMLDGMDDGKIKAAVKGVLRVFPLFLLLIALQFAIVGIYKIIFVVQWSLISSLISIVFEVYHEHFYNEIKMIKEAKKQKKIDKLKESMR